MSKSVDQASPAPTLAAKASWRPSGEKATSSMPPKGGAGTSASSPRVTSTGSPPATGTTKRWERRPSSQAFQWRTKSRS